MRMGILTNPPRGGSSGADGSKAIGPLILLKATLSLKLG